ncbi:hypothetical protein H6768_06810 [Candidatus Peribacteria bacterium]|nr:hypothetical protein [Candidatus Peribacteria bacterium]
MCTRWVRVLQNFGLLVGVSYLGLKSAPKNIQKLSQKNDMWVIARGRKNFTGYDGFVELLRQSWIGRIIVWILSIKILKVI